MKILITIIFVSLVVFLMPPVAAGNQNEVTVKDCCGHQEKKKQTLPTQDYNPFVNCCFRTFEVSSQVWVKQPAALLSEPFFSTFTSSECKGFKSSCWHPPRQLS